jgi:hypothetical protein
MGNGIIADETESTDAEYSDKCVTTDATFQLDGISGRYRS